VQPPELVERDALRSLVGAPGVKALDVGSAVAVSIAAVPNERMVHHTVGVGEDEPADDDVLEALTRFYADLGVRFYLCVTPSVHPADLRERLAARGFEHGYDWMKFTCTLGATPEVRTTLEVRRVGPDGGDDFAAVVAGAFGMPPGVLETMRAVPELDGFTAYVGYDGDVPAAAGALFVSGALGWLSFTGTLPEHRRRGGQSAILAARFDRARELGVATLITETGVIQEGRPSNSYRNLVRSGFREGYIRENYLSPRTCGAQRRGATL
jgi:GNAT superfamily N-acetyltransferase